MGRPRKYNTEQEIKDAKLKYWKTSYQKHKEEKKSYARLYYKAHKQQMIAYKKKWRDKNPLKVKKHKLSWLKEITVELYYDIFNNQNGKCAICGIARTELSRDMCIDHNHATNKLRGLLCSNCNFMLGYGKESIEVFKNAIKYLKKHNKF